MKVLLLTPRPQLLIPALENAGDTYTVAMGPPDIWPEDCDMVVSFGYRHIIKEPYLSAYKNRIINIHASVLPWNRGADPNFWSWYDGTPKGVSAHLVDNGIDTGPVIGRMDITKWPANSTLATSYNFLMRASSSLFTLEWSRWRLQDWFVLPRKGEGSYHKVSDKEPIFEKLSAGWDTPVDEVVNLGEVARREGAVN